MRSHDNRFDHLSRAIIAAAFVIALGGFTGGSCFGPGEEGEPCGEDTCRAGEICQRQVFDCTQAPCPDLLTCVPVEPPAECMSDVDCGDGFYCDFDGAFPPGYEPDPTNCIAMTGVCRPLTTCTSNADCGPWEHCEFTATTVRCDVDCGPNMDCRCPEELPEAGICQPGPAECWSDADCPAGSYCPDSGMDCGCPEGEPCPLDCGMIPSTCQPRPADCSSDYDCAPGEFCNIDDELPPTACDCLPGDDCYCGAPAPMGTCEPRINGECNSDADCARGESCSFMEIVCGTDPDGSGGDCWEQRGICIADPIDECQADSDCAPGEFCAIYDYDCLCAGGPGEPCDCGTGGGGVCEPLPNTGCQSDADCPGGYCEFLDSCTAIGCPEPSSVCVFPTCDDGGPVLCDMMPPICEGGFIAAARNGCWECVDPHTCNGGPSACDTLACPAGQHCELADVVCVTEPCDPQAICVADDTCWGAWTDETGSCRAPNDGTLPPECCAGACNADIDCGPNATCWDGLCVAEPIGGGCPGEDDPRVSYVCTGSECWVIGAWICPDGQELFSNACGGGCIDTAICSNLGEWECQADALCSPIYGPSHCDPSGVCTTDETFQACTPAF